MSWHWAIVMVMVFVPSRSASSICSAHGGDFLPSTNLTDRSQFETAQ